MHILHRFLFLLFLLPALASAQGLDRLDSDKGILGYPLGGGHDKMEGTLIKTGKRQKLVVFRPEKDDSVIYNNIPLKSVRLHFWKNELHSILVRTEGEKRTDRLFKHFENIYGPGEKNDQFGYNYYWKGSEVILTYEKDMVTGDARFQFFSIPVHNNYELYWYNKQYGDQ